MSGDDAKRREAAGRDSRRRRWLLLCAASSVIAAGLALRAYGYGVGFGFLVVKYGGSVLWGGMVYLLVAAIAVRQSSIWVAALSLGLAIAVELSRLIHETAFDAFRLTLVGALLLGRIFSPWNIAAYAIGIGITAGSDNVLRRRGRC